MVLYYYARFNEVEKYSIFVIRSFAFRSFQYFLLFHWNRRLHSALPIYYLRYRPSSNTTFIRDFTFCLTGQLWFSNSIMVRQQLGRQSVTCISVWVLKVMKYIIFYAEVFLRLNDNKFQESNTNTFISNILAPIKCHTDHIFCFIVKPATVMYDDIL